MSVAFKKDQRDAKQVKETLVLGGMVKFFVLPEVHSFTSEHENQPEKDFKISRPDTISEKVVENQIFQEPLIKENAPELNTPNFQQLDGSKVTNTLGDQLANPNKSEKHISTVRIMDDKFLLDQKESGHKSDKDLPSASSIVNKESKADHNNVQQNLEKLEQNIKPDNYSENLYEEYSKQGQVGRNYPHVLEHSETSNKGAEKRESLFFNMFGFLKNRNSSLGNGPQIVSLTEKNSSPLSYPFIFRAKSDELLFNLGDSYYKDFKNGLKHFAFAQANSGESQKRSILGIASFIKYFEDVKILILTPSLKGNIFTLIEREASHNIVPIKSIPKFKYSVLQHDAISCLEIDEIYRCYEKLDGIRHKLPVILKELLADYDVVLYDLPPVNQRKDRYEMYLPLLQSIENVTLTISLRKTKFSEVAELKRYFEYYKISIKGSILDSYEYREKAVWT